jgi:hypothetical protein
MVLLSARHFTNNFVKLVDKIKYKNLAQVNQVVRKVDPDSKINVKCNYDLEIKPYDLLDCPSSTCLRATVFDKNDLEMVPYDTTDKPDPEILRVRLESLKDRTEVTDDLKISVHGNTVTVSGGLTGDLKCILEVPVKSDLTVENKSHTSIEEMYTDYLDVVSDGDIRLKSVRSVKMDLKSTAGHITTNGLILAQDIKAATEDDGASINGPLATRL